MGRVDLNRPLSRELYDSIELGVDRRSDVLARLGPPDGLRYTSTDLILDYTAASHRATDLRFFVPTDVFPGPNPFFVLKMFRYFLDPFQESEVFLPTASERMARGAVEAVIGVIPFARGEDLLILHGRQLRSDVLRVVLNRETLAAEGKALRLSTGEYAQDSLARRVLLRGD